MWKAHHHAMLCNMDALHTCTVYLGTMRTFGLSHTAFPSCVTFTSCVCVCACMPARKAKEKHTHSIAKVCCARVFVRMNWSGMETIRMHAYQRSIRSNNIAQWALCPQLEKWLRLTLTQTRSHSYTSKRTNSAKHEHTHTHTHTRSTGGIHEQEIPVWVQEFGQTEPTRWIGRR